jgi:hypothetical protein
MLNHARREKHAKTLMNFIALALLWQKLIESNQRIEGQFRP